MANILGLFDQQLGEKINQTIETGLEKKTTDLVLSVSPATGSIVATHGASVLLACSSANLTGRKLLVVKNTSETQQVYIGESSVSAIYEKGITLEPLETKRFELADDTIELYARSSGYSAVLDIMEA